MAEYTTHYNLKKPAKNENYNIDVANQNNDIIDEKLYGKVDKKAGKDLSTNDFTNEYKKKLDTLKNYDDAEVIKQITSFNERAGKVEEANTEISKNVEALKTDNEANKTAISELKETTKQNATEIEAIKQEQTIQNENIEKNAEGIAQNKKDVDEELTKIKKENSLLKSQIPEGQASGNDIHLEDSSNMPFEWRLNGGSRQEMREGYNLANLDADSFVKNGVTVTNNGDGSWTFNGTSNSSGDLILTKNILLNHKIYQFEDTKYLFKTIVVSGSFSNPDKVIVQTSAMGQDNGVDNFATLYNKLSDGVFVNIFNKKSTSHLSRFELYCGPNVTFNNYTIKILFAKTDNNELEWEQYGTLPSTEFQSKIENVGDNINILNKKVVDASNNLRGNALDTGRRLIANKDGTYTYGAFKLGGRELLGKTLGIHADIETTGGNPRISIFAGNSSSLTKSLLQVVLSASGTGYMTIPSNLNSELDTISAVLYVTTDASVVAGTYVDYTNLKVQVGSGEVVYSAYNCGSLGVTIGNENFGNAELLYSQMKNFSFTNVRKELVDNKNCIVFLNTQFRDAKGFKGLKFNYKKDTRYVIRGKFRIYDTSITSGSDLWIGAYDKDGKEIGHDNYQAKGSEWIQFSFLTDINSSFDHIDFSYGTTAYWCLDMDSLEIYEGTSVREVPKVQSQAIIFPLTEGQRLYNGSYLAKDGIHNIRTQIKLLSSGGNLFVSALGTYQVFGKTQKGIKQGSRLLSNYFKDYGSVNAIKDAVGIANNNSTDRIYVSNGISTTLDEFKDWLNKCENAGRPVILEYELAEEEIIPYTTEQQAVIDKILYTYKNITNIAVSDKLASIDVTYKKDLETILNNQAKEYNERLSNIENLLNTTENTEETDNITEETTASTEEKAEE